MSLTSAKLRNIPGPDAKRVVSAYLDSSKDFDPTYDSIYDASSSVVLSNSCEIASTSGYSAKSEVTAINTHEALPTAINGLNVSQSSNFHIGTKIYIIQKLINWKKAIIKKPDTSQDGETTRKEILSDIKSLSIFERSVSCDVTIDIEGFKANETTAKGKVENPKNRWISSSTCYWWIWLLIFLIVISSLIGLSMTYIIMTMKSDPEPAKFFEDSLWVERLEWNAKNPKKVTALDLTSSRRIIVFSSRTDECSTKVSCIQIVQSIQCSNHFFDDIVYNFLIGGDGRIYVGRGWDARGEHKYGHNDAIGVAFIGNFKGAEPSQLQIDGFKSLMETGLKEEKLAKTSEVFSDNLTWIGNLGEDLRENEINLIRALNLT